MPSPLIQVTEATFGYDGVPILHRVSLEVRPGEFIGLVGPNGAGKSTLFKGLLGLLRPQVGEVNRACELKGRIGYVPQREQLDPIYPLTAWDVVRMGLVAANPWYRYFGKSAAVRIGECLKRVDMEAKRFATFAQLSGGQRQRVLIARALVIDPLLLVLDEPTAGIDPVAEENIMELLMGLNKDQNLTILMVSHQLESLRERVQRVIVVKNGGTSSGSAKELLDPEHIHQLLSGRL